MNVAGISLWAWLGYAGILSGCMMLAHSVWAWCRTARAYGHPPWRVSLHTFRFALKSIHRWSLYLLGGGVVLLLVLGDDVPWSLFATIVAFGLSLLVDEFTPPAILLLGNSRPQTISLRHRLARAVHPFRVVVLFDDCAADSGLRLRLQRRYLKGDNFRTVRGDWRDVAHPFMDMVPHIVFDCNIASPAVVEEARRVQADPGLLKKTLFVVDADGKAPALDSAGVELSPDDVQRITMSEIVLTLRQIGKLGLSPFAEVMFRLESYSENYDDPVQGEAALYADLLKAGAALERKVKE